MSGLSDIRIAVQSSLGDANARAVLHELESLLQQLLNFDVGGSIDLRSLPLSQEDYELLESSLGKGEVRAEIDSFGLTEVIETGIAGVWWVTHYNADEEVVAQFLEVAWCPELLQTADEDVGEGLHRLRETLGLMRLVKESNDAG